MPRPAARLTNAADDEGIGFLVAGRLKNIRSPHG
jgi:hypothetical protein